MTVEEPMAPTLAPGHGSTPEISLADYAKLFDEMGRGFCIIQLLFDKTGRPYDAVYLTANAAFEEHTGIANPTGKRIKEDIPRLEQHWFDFYGGVAVSRRPNSIENGSEAMGRWFDVYAVPFGAAAHRTVAVFFTDISARKQAEATLIAKDAELQHSQQRSRLAITMAQLGTWTFAVEEQAAFFDARMCEIWGKDPSSPDVSLEYALNGIHEEDRQAAALRLAAALDPGSEGVFEVEARVVRSDGTTRWILANGQTRFAGAGDERHAVELVGTALDVTERRAAEQALRASEERSRVAIKVAALGTWVYDVASDTAHMDARMCEILGRDAGAQMISVPETLAYVHADDRDTMMAAMAAANDPAGDGVYSVQVRLIREDGAARWIQADGQVEFVGEGAARQPLRIIGTVADITERRVADQARILYEESLRRELRDARSLQQLSSKVIIEDDVDSLYEDVLDAAIEIMQADCASVRMYVPDRNALRLLRSRNLNAETVASWGWVEASSTTISGTSFVTRQRVLVSDVEAEDAGVSIEDLGAFGLSGIRAVQTTPLVSRSGHAIGVISTYWREPHTPTDRELGLMDVVARQVADVIERLETDAELLRALAAKDEFLGLVSHELRTPITTILGNASVLQRLGNSLDPRERAVALKDIRDQAERLNRTVDDLLALARADRGALEAEPLELARSVKMIIDEYGSETAAPILLSAGDAPLIVSGEPGVLSQVLRNFISNAEKYGGGSPIEIEVARHGSSTAAVCVMDRGMGISLADSERVFDAFYRAEEVRAIGGLGIGLSVCKRLAEAVGGRVWAEPREGGGSLFGLALPMYEDAPEA